ncbi:MAG: acetyl-CoA C-acetyltransferase [Gammaproteobacteria bacterium]|nr:acetyl-CoA C-acetyltransferase [Gammaproteobacteria bacterium]
MPEAYILDAIRTPRGKGKKDGSLHEVKPVVLLAGLLRSLQVRNQLDTSMVDDVVMGVVAPIGEQGSVLPKISALLAGWDWRCSGLQINRFCASGLEAVNLAAQKVRSGWEDLVVAGGIECMSRVSLGSDGGAWAQDPQTNFATRFVPQGIGADLIATLENISRREVDEYAYISQQRAQLAKSSGFFRDSLIPVKDEGDLLILEEDEYIKPHTTLDGLTKLAPAFAQIGALGFDKVAIQSYPHIEKIHHIHHAGNSSGIVDGAAAVLIASEKGALMVGRTPKARIVATALSGADPTSMLLGPIPATKKVLHKAQMHIEDIDLFEVNEAFAVVPLKFMREFNLSHDKVNVNGGAIALGHPLGATGAMLLGTLVDELIRRNLRYGLITLCVGAGMGIASIIEII